MIAQWSANARLKLSDEHAMIASKAMFHELETKKISLNTNTKPIEGLVLQSGCNEKAIPVCSRLAIRKVR